MEYTTLDMLAFGSVIIVALLIDLYAHRKDEAVSIKSATIWSVIWISVALAFAAYVNKTHGTDDMSLFLAGYALEKSLSVDNLFVIMAIFSAFAIDGKYQHRVLYYGILGAIVLRFIFIFAGTSLIEILGTPALILFGLVVLYSAYLMWKNMQSDADEIEDYTNHWSVVYTKRFVSVHPKVENHNFFTKIDGKWMATPLFLCLVCVEISDLIFAVDSVPAIIAITEKPFLIYSSNIFAILGLRSLYFVLEAAKQYLCHLEKAVIVILVFIGLKMLIGASFGVHMDPMISLGVVLGLLTLGIVGSIMYPEKGEQ